MSRKKQKKECFHGVPLEYKNKCFYCNVEKRKRKQKLYTISTLIFTSLEDAEYQLNEWYDNRTLKKDSIVFEVKRAYYPRLKVEEKK